MKKRLVFLIATMVMTIILITGCRIKTDTPIIGRFFGLNSNQIFKVDTLVCEKPEYMIVFMNTANQYKKNFGGTIDWEVKIDDDTTLKDYLMDKVKEEMSVQYALASMAVDEGIRLADSEKTSIGEKAQEYFSGLSEKEKEYTGADVQTVEEIYKNYLLADKLYDTLTEQIDEEVSEEEARVIQMEYIRMSGKDAKSTLGEVRNSLKKNQQNFLETAKRYTEDNVTERTLKKNEAKAKYEKEAFNLNDNELSKIIEDDGNYYLVYCVKAYDEQATNANKEQIITDKKNRYFSNAYEKYLKTIKTDFNTGAWKKIEFPDDDITSDNLMSIFETL